MPLIIVLLFVGGMVRSVLQVLGLLRRTSGERPDGRDQSAGRQSSAGQKNKRTASSDSSDKQKIFSDDEGEYVDYEEVK
ncbi:MAG: DUF4834 family protein [Clostridium sp.]|nr:DUF4834 family protein [Clostridium sp.]